MTRNTARLAAVASIATALLATAPGTATARPDRPGVVVDGNTWHLRDALSSGPATTTFSYGSIHDYLHVTGDWDGNGSRTPGIVRTVGGNYFWFLRNSNSAGPVDIPPFSYGKSGPDLDFADFPVVGDWDGDGRDGIGVVRRWYGVATPRWLLRDATTTGSAQHDFTYGARNDMRFVAGDWDGNGTDTAGVVRQGQDARPTWLLRNANSVGPAQLQFQYGGWSEGGSPVVGDWDGDGRDGIGLLRTDSGGGHRWLLRYTPDAGSAQHSFSYGPSGSDVVRWR